MADLPSGFDLEALLAPIPGDSPVGADIREDFSSQSPYNRLRDARSEARDAEKQADTGDSDAPDPTPMWRTVRDLALKTLKENAKDLEVASWLTEALIRSQGFLGLAAGARTISGLAERYWDNVFPMPDEYGMETRVSPVQGLNGQDGGGSLMQPLNKITLFERTDGTPVAYYLYQSSEQLTTLDKARLDVGHTHDDHAVMEQGRMETRQCRLLPTMLRRRAGEDAAHLARQSAGRPERAGLVEEIPHLCAHVAEAGGRSEDYRVGVRELGRLGIRHVRKGLARLAGTAQQQCVLRHEFRHLQQRHFGILDFARTGRDLFRHAEDVAIHAVEHDLDSGGHENLLFNDGRGSAGGPREAALPDHREASGSASRHSHPVG